MGLSVPPVQNPFHSWKFQGRASHFMISQAPAPSSDSDGHMPIGVCVHSCPCFLSLVGMSKQAFSALCPCLALVSVLPVSLGRGVQAGGGLCFSFGSDDVAGGHARPNKWNPCIHPPETKRSHHSEKGTIIGSLRTGGPLHKHREMYRVTL